MQKLRLSAESEGEYDDAQIAVDDGQLGRRVCFVGQNRVGRGLHIAINNSKRQILNTFHNVKPEFLQKYLDEFCYKFNRRYLGEALFNHLLIACVSYKNEFRYVYG